MKSVSIILYFFICSLQLLSQPASRVNFNEGWKFYLGDTCSVTNILDNNTVSRDIDLPHDWSIESDFSVRYPAAPGGGALPGGIGWYRKKFFIDNDVNNKSVFIDFDGVYCNSSVWVNGYFLGKRPNGYISFQYDITPYIKYGQNNIICVKVDNSLQPNSRWYSGSGIYRNVWLTITNPIHVSHWGTYITTPVISDSLAIVNIETSIDNDGKPGINNIDVQYVIQDARGNKVASAMHRINGLQKPVALDKQEMNIRTPILWSLANPYQYKMITTLLHNGTILDKYYTTFGIRTFSFDPYKGFILNNEFIKLKGVCNHHDLGCLGTAVNTRALQRQLQLLKEMGCNAIRTSHNPPAPELLQLCDSMGFIVMDEMFDMWRKRKTMYDYSMYFPEWYEKDLTDFILRDRNHPSVMMWSVGNEVLEQWTHVDADTLNLQQANTLLNFTNQIGNKNLDTGLHINSLLAAKLVDIVKKLDVTRPITSANNETQPYNHLFRSGSMDVIGFNYHEQNWINFHNQYPDKKLLITESTSALMSRGYYLTPSDSIYIWPRRPEESFDRDIHQCSAYDNCHVPWGTTHEESWRMVKNYPHIAGLFIWTGFDYLGEPTPFGWPSRSSYFGIIDLAGFPKDVYYMYQSEWSDKDVLHIFPHWNWHIGDTVDVWAYYNHADEVELFLNGKSLGVRSKKGDDLHVVWRVPFAPGILKAISRKNGKIVLTRQIATAGKPVAIKLTADRNQIHANGKDLSFVTAVLVDESGIEIPFADNQVSFSISGPGNIIGTDNGNPVDTMSLKRLQRHLFNGKALAVVKASNNKGIIFLTATASALKPSTIKIVLQ